MYERASTRLLEAVLEVPATSRRNAEFMYNGAPEHFFIAMGNHFNAIYPGKWIGRGGPIAWTPRFPNLNPLHFFFWGYLKSLVYETTVASMEDITARIVVASAEITRT
ncbi:uncharacterized protein TNCV_4988261 [Trichonephila clavipes]|nr:uncharacterized protein TNCV_4988261 [Trichonephila clavipes]